MTYCHPMMVDRDDWKAFLVMDWDFEYWSEIRYWPCLDNEPIIARDN